MKFKLVCIGALMLGLCSCGFHVPNQNRLGSNISEIAVSGSYHNKFYKVLQKHTSQVDWTPDTTSSLYVEIANPTEEWPEFKQPTGAHDAYAKDTKVTFEGKHYKSLIDANVYSPTTYPQGWELVE